MKVKQLTLLFVVSLLPVFSPAKLRADEGMWLFNNPPRKILKEKYNFNPTEAWLENVQKSSVRFNSGGSGSFISSQGLVMTNHHVGADALQKLSTPENDYLKVGFHARTRAQELKCVDLELNVLMEIEDVTDRVNVAVKPDMSPADAQKARRAVMNTIEKESLDKTGMRSDVVTLYQGGQYHLYRYKKYTDIRLVFAPESDIAFFGGDPDNFEYPRYDLDVCFFRAYEDGMPAQLKHYLPWSKAGAGDNELVFVTGHPGRTDRLNTLAHLEYFRDVSFPHMLNVIRRREVLLNTYSERSDENSRRARDELFGLKNSRKARLGGLAGLQDPDIMGQKQRDEKELRAAVDKDAKLRKETGDAWGQVDGSLDVARKIRLDYSLLEQGQAFNTTLFDIARDLVRIAAEDKKPNAERLREYTEAARESLEQELFSEAPIYEDLEIVKLGDSLGMYLEIVGVKNALAQKVLAGSSPRERASQLISGTRLKDVAVRRELAKGGQSAIDSSDDPLIRLAVLIDPAAREVRETFEQKVEEAQRQAYAKIAKARFAVYGTDEYPDATFTLRLSFGTVGGYTENGKRLPPWTTIGGAFQHAEEHHNKEPFRLPESWIKARNKLNLQTPFNFVSTNDIIGGNSGSPVINRQGEVVGIIFDGNLPSLVWDFVYDDKVGRAISVHSAGIVEALRKVYNAKELLAEIGR